MGECTSLPLALSEVCKKARRRLCKFWWQTVAQSKNFSSQNSIRASFQSAKPAAAMGEAASSSRHVRGEWTEGSRMDGSDEKEAAVLFYSPNIYNKCDNTKNCPRLSPLPLLPALVVLPLEHVEVKAARPPGVRVRVAQQSHGAYLITIVSEHGAGDTKI